VRRGERRRELPSYPSHFGDRQRALPCEERGEALAFHVLHDDERAVVLLVNVVDRGDVRVIQPRGGARFPEGTLPQLLQLGLGQAEREYDLLDGDVAAQDLVAGQIPTAVLGSTPLIPHHKSGRIRILAFTSKDRFPTLPEIPTLHESGFPGFDTGQWLGLLAPRGASAEVVNRLYAETRKALELEDVKERLLQAALLPVGSTPKEFASLIRSDIERWTRLAAEAGVQPQ